MVLSIRTTGVEDYVDGSANIRMLVIGPPGSGKTRMSSFWPKPIYADCESGRASLADRNVPFAEVKNSQDMLDFLVFLKKHEATPKADRPFQTVVIDTLDGFQRRVFDERLQQTKKQTFSGFDDWGYLDSRMQMLMTRLLNLDYNVIVTCHYKDKVVKDGDNDIREYMLQLKGDIGNTCFNDFDLVGWLGTYWAADDGERVEKRGLSFKRSPERPWLKDRFGALPTWVPVTLDDVQDYEFIRDALSTKLEGLKPGETVGEIPSSDPDGVSSAGVIQPTGGPLPPQDPRDVPLHQHDKTTVAKMCRDEGVTTCVDGTPIKANTTKAELVQALEYARAIKEQPTLIDLVDAETSSVPPESDAAPESVPIEPQVDAPVDAATGEIAPEQPVGDVIQAAVVEVPSTSTPADNTVVPEPTTTEDLCEEPGCSVSLATQDSRYVQLAEFKYKQRLCGAHYMARRNQQIDAVAR